MQSRMWYGTPSFHGYTGVSVEYFFVTGTPYPLLCPNGTYTNDSDVGLEEASACHDCPPGKYCTAGKIQVTLKLIDVSHS